MSEARKLIIVAGPTASGKTNLACALAEHLDAEVISADSQQCYRGLDVGTAKPSLEEQARARHHLLDIAWPEDQLDVAQFIAKADAAIAEVISRGKRALLVGGTGLWIRALVQGLVEAPGRDDNFRENFRARVAAEGLPALFSELQRIDPEAAQRILPGDRTRIERALEVHAQGGKTLSSLQREHRFAERRYRARFVLMDPPRDKLVERIEARTRSFFAVADGVKMTLSDAPLVQETLWLRERIRQIPAAEKALGIIGYGETSAAIDAGLTDGSLEEAREKIAARTRQYAKRQRTWFKKDAPLLDETGAPIMVGHFQSPKSKVQSPIDRSGDIDELCSTLREWYESRQ